VEARWGLLPPSSARREWSTVSASPAQLSRNHLSSTPNVVYTFPGSMGCQVFVYPTTTTTTISLEVGADLRPPSASATQKFVRWERRPISVLGMSAPFTATRLSISSSILHNCDDWSWGLRVKTCLGVTRKVLGRSERLTSRKLYPTWDSSGDYMVSLFLGLLSLPLSGCESPL